MPKLTASKSKSKKGVQKTVSGNVSKFHQTDRYKEMKGKYGAAKANKIAVAAAYTAARGGRKKKK